MATYKHKALLSIIFALEKKKAEKISQKHLNCVIKIKPKKSKAFSHICLPHCMMGPFFQCQLPK